MLRLIGAIIVVLLFIGPLLVQIGLLDHGGLIRSFVDLEVRTFSDLVAFIRHLFNRGP
jgi:hypothetical protein